MRVGVERGAIQEIEADAVVVNLFEGVTEPGGATGAVDRALGGAISELIAQGDLRGKANEVTVIYPRGQVPAKRVLVVGLGKREGFDLERVRAAAGAAARRARELGARTVATIAHGGGVGGLDLEAAAQATVEGSLLALYRFDPKALAAQLATAMGVEAGGGGAGQDGEGAEEPREVEALTLVELEEGGLDAARAGAAAAEAIAAGAFLARDLVNTPPNLVNPERMAQVARELAEEHGFGIEVGDREWAASLGMGGFVAVSGESVNEPRFIVLEHNPRGSSEAPVVLVGKGVTFDSGGLSLKTTEGMIEMKSDMAGAAAVLGTMKALALLGSERRVVGIATCVENMPGGSAFRPDDVLRMLNGKTVEIKSTDAEGRLILADALAYASRYEPAAVIDLATLTGACVVALGRGVAAGLFCNDEVLQERLVAAAKATHERAWPMPLYEDYREKIKSEVADLTNTGGRMGGVGTASVFLEEFTDYPWAHLDIAPVAFGLKAGAYTAPGATGYGVRLLAEFLR